MNPPSPPGKGTEAWVLQACGRVGHQELMCERRKGERCGEQGRILGHREEVQGPGGATHTGKSLLLGTHTQRGKGILTPFRAKEAAKRGAVTQAKSLPRDPASVSVEGGWVP